MKRFVAFEGIDGSGKTTVSKRVHDELQKRGIDCILTWEPFNTTIKKCIDEFLVSEANPLSIAFLFMADRVEHSKMIEGWLNEGKIVISDRYEDSTYAYQGAQLEKEVENPIEFLKSIIHPYIIHPDRVYILDVDSETALRRSRKDGDLKLFEKRELLERVRDIYLNLGKGERYMILDGKMEIEEIVKICLRDILGE